MIQVFWPSIAHPSAVRRAVVRSDATSEPEPGSDIAIAFTWPAQTDLRTASRCASSPNRSTAAATISVTPRPKTGTPARSSPSSSRRVDHLTSRAAETLGDDDADPAERREPGVQLRTVGVGAAFRQAVDLRSGPAFSAPELGDRVRERQPLVAQRGAHRVTW